MGLLVETIHGKKNTRPPFWFMRQAGRYLPEYRKLRERKPDFFSCCFDPSFATEVTLQPLRRFDMDAAIIFSDILVLPLALGVDIHFEKGEGPVVSSGQRNNILRADEAKKNEMVAPVLEAIRRVKKELSPEKDLIGFAGAPWTILCYLYGGKRANEFEPVRRALYQQEEEFFALLEAITQQTASYLLQQIEAGADCVMLFDSWAGMVPASWQQKILIEPVKNITTIIKKIYPNTPVIAFPKGLSDGHAQYIKKTGVDVLSVDQFTCISDIAKNLPMEMTLQGNLDPLLLLFSEKQILFEAEKILTAMHGKKHIFNLGHGMVPETPVEHVAALSRFIREFAA